MVATDADAPPPCDFCGTTTAVVYCRADSARLCLACDREVHAANTVSSRHHRSLLCDFCAAAPATIFCPSPPHRLVLCSNCDFDAHRAADHGNDRRAVEPFTGCTIVAELAAALGFGDVKGVFSGDANGGGRVVEEGWALEAPPVFSWDDLIQSPTTTTFHGFQALGIPPPPKDRNSCCGKHKEEIHRQLCELIKGEIDGVKSEELEPDMDFKLVPLDNLHGGNLSSDYDYNPVFIEVPSCEASTLQWNQIDNQDAGNNAEISFEQQKSSILFNSTFVDFDGEAETPANLRGSCNMDSGNPASLDNLPSAPQKAVLEPPDRSSVISRYKEKRKTRRYDKLIRYESRKARADRRVRIKGRFAKANQVG